MHKANANCDSARTAVLFCLLPVGQLQQLTAGAKNRMAKGTVDATMVMTCDQGLLVDLIAIADAEIPTELTTAADKQLLVNLTTTAGEQILAGNQQPSDAQHDASLLLARFLQDKRSSPNKHSSPNKPTSC